MLRSELMQATVDLCALIDRLKLKEVLQAAFQKTRLDGLVALTTFSQLDAWYSGASPAVHKLVRIFDLNDLFSPIFWAQSVKNSDDSSGGPPRIKVAEIFNTVRFTRDKAPLFVAMLARDGDPPSIEPSTDITAPQTSNVIRVMMAEDAGESSTPERVVEVMKSLTELYTALAILHGEVENGLSVIGCDSGSTKVFDFRGSGELIREIKNLIIDTYREVAFRKESKDSINLENAAKRLAILERVAELRDKQALSHEAAGRIERGIVSGLTKFFDAGLVIPEIHAIQLPQPESLLRPEGKYLLSPPSDSPPAKAAPPPSKPKKARPRQTKATTANTTTDSFPSLTPEQIALTPEQIALLRHVLRASEPADTGKAQSADEEIIKAK